MKVILYLLRPKSSGQHEILGSQRHLNIIRIIIIILIPRCHYLSGSSSSCTKNNQTLTYQVFSFSSNQPRACGIVANDNIHYYITITVPRPVFLVSLAGNRTLFSPSGMELLPVYTPVGCTTIYATKDGTFKTRKTFSGTVVPQPRGN